MSTRIMSECWPLQMPPTPKSVLISLADNASDQGVCWPSIPTIAERTCFSERAVQNAIKWLEGVGVVSANRSNGRHTSYRLTPAAYAPPQEMHPAATAPQPQQEIPKPPQQVHQPPQQVPSNRNKPSRTVKATVIERPVDVTEQTWMDFQKLRKSKKADITETVLAGIRREAAIAGWGMEAALSECCVRGWAGFKAKWVQDNNRGANHAQPKLTPSELTAVGIALNNGGEIPDGYENNGGVVAEVERNLRPQVDLGLRDRRNGIGGADLGQGIKWLNGGASGGRPESQSGEFRPVASDPS